MGKFYSSLGTNENLVYVVMICIGIAFTIEVLHYGMVVYNNIKYGNDE